PLRVQVPGRDDPRHGACPGVARGRAGGPALAGGDRRLDGRHAGAGVGGDVPGPGRGRGPAVDDRAVRRDADRVEPRRSGGDHLGPRLPRRRVLRRRPGRGPPPGPRGRPDDRPGHLPQRRAVHRPVRPAAPAAARLLARPALRHRGLPRLPRRAARPPLRRDQLPAPQPCDGPARHRARAWRRRRGAGQDHGQGAGRVGDQRRPLPAAPAVAHPRGRRPGRRIEHVARDRLAPRSRRVPPRARPDRTRPHQVPGGDDMTQHPDGARLDPQTVAIRAGRGASGSSLAPVIWATSTFVAGSVEGGRRLAASTCASELYSRYGNPTVNAFVDAPAELEGDGAARAFSSGMGAVAAVVLGLCSKGDHIVSQRQVYAGTQMLLQSVCPRFGIDVTLVDGADPEAWEAAVIPGRTMLLLAETPANPRLDLVDLERLGAIKGPMKAVDSTFATPIGQRPLDHGVDLVIHSATKAIGGHNDVTLGVVAGSRELIDWVWGFA